MCYKLLAALILALILLQYLYSSLAPPSFPDFFTNSTRRSTLSSVYSPHSDLRNGYESKNLSSWIYLQITPTNAGESLPLCPIIPPNLEGPTKQEPPGAGENGAERIRLLAQLEANLSRTGLQEGGQWRPLDCRPRTRVALVVPYRDRPDHLAAFLVRIHPFLQRQLLNYGLFIIEQAGTDDFNRAMLLNVGFVEAMGMREFDCFIFHDVDLLPEDDRNLYTCPDQPRHMSVAVDVFNYRLPYPDIFGGVCAMSRVQFEFVNGFSNVFWGWGGEDDDMAARIKAAGLHITRYPPSIARYTMLPHLKQKASPKRFENLYNGPKRLKTDGLNSLQYRRLEVKLNRLFTWVLVELFRS